MKLSLEATVGVFVVLWVVVFVVLWVRVWLKVNCVCVMTKDGPDFSIWWLTPSMCVTGFGVLNITQTCEGWLRPSANCCFTPVYTRSRMNASTDLSPHPPIHPPRNPLYSFQVTPVSPPLTTHRHPDTDLKQYLHFKMGQLGCEGLFKFKLSSKSDQLMQNWDYNRKPKSTRYQQLRLQISSAPEQAAAVKVTTLWTAQLTFHLNYCSFIFIWEVYIFLDLKELNSNSIILSSVQSVRITPLAK